MESLGSSKTGWAASSDRLAVYSGLHLCNHPSFRSLPDNRVERQCTWGIPWLIRAKLYKRDMLCIYLAQGDKKGLAWPHLLVRLSRYLPSALCIPASESALRKLYSTYASQLFTKLWMRMHSNLTYDYHHETQSIIEQYGHDMPYMPAFANFNCVSQNRYSEQILMWKELSTTSIMYCIVATTCKELNKRP